MHAFSHLPALTARRLGTVLAVVVAMTGLALVAIGDAQAERFTCTPGPGVECPSEDPSAPPSVCKSIRDGVCIGARYLAPAPCKAAGGAIDGMARFICRFYPPGDGRTGGAPVVAASGGRVGFLRAGENYVLCQMLGVSVRNGRYTNNNWAYTRAVTGRFGWVNAVYARGGDSNGRFGGGVPTRCPARVGSPPTRIGLSRYVALGDSYSSGVGSETYYPGPCERSPLSYAPLLAAELKVASFDFRACGGKKASEMADQLDGVRPDTTLVTITAGGNDLEFSNVVKACGVNPLEDCSSEIANAARIIREDLPGRLLGLYQEVRRRAAAARLVVLGYPGLIEPEGSCGAMTLSGGERAAIQQLADRLADVTAAATRTVSNTVFVDSRAAFKGHLACGPAEWINGFSPRSWNESFHPNQSGYQAFASLLRRAL